MLNKSILMGRLTADAETKTFDEKKRVTNFTLAVDRDYVGSDNNRPDGFHSDCCLEPSGKVHIKVPEEGGAGFC
ncbi:MAG: single-stranded DNA-binding protein [Lutisporaceae bacterium]